MARHAKWEKDRPPLDLDFFVRAKAAAREPSLVQRVADHAVAVGHTNPFDTKSPTSLEHYLGLLYFRLLQKPTSADRTAYFDLLRLYNRELLSTTNWLVGRKSGPLEKLLRLELSSGAKLTVVTFNHDLLVENALASLPVRTFGERFCLRHSYGLDTTPASALQSAGADMWELCSGSHGEVVSICKLHGSLNWVFTSRDLTPSVNLAQAKRKKIYVLRHRRPRPDHTVTLSSSRRRFYLWPVVVPPIYEKQSFIRNHLQSAWDMAGAALESADKVVFFGYSFPAADHHARFFFEGLANRNVSLKRPHVVNPDFRVVETAWEVLGATRVHAYRSLDEYLTPT
jgi:hypothetical protein